jgi:predicted RNase H-like nuclease (RuvC/YqgF family)
MAQDFFSAFGVGEEERYITSIDADGVSLAAIQGLYEVVREKEREMAAQQKRIVGLEQHVSKLEAALTLQRRQAIRLRARLTALERRVAGPTRPTSH